jgi:hypothetical protein
MIGFIKTVPNDTVDSHSSHYLPESDSTPTARCYGYVHAYTYGHSDVYCYGNIHPPHGRNRNGNRNGDIYLHPRQRQQQPAAWYTISQIGGSIVPAPRLSGITGTTRSRP